MKHKTIDIFLPDFSQPKSEYRPIEFAQAQAICIHQVNNQTNLNLWRRWRYVFIYYMCPVHLLFHNFHSIISFSK